MDYDCSVSILKNQSAAVVMLSCDAYEDLWPSAVNNLLHNWSDLGLQMFFVSNLKPMKVPEVSNIRTGLDENWSNSLRIALEQIEEKYVFLLLDDLHLISKPTQYDLIGMLEALKDNNLSTMHFRPVPPNQMIERSKKWSRYPNGYPYSCNVNALWKKADLLKVLAYGESAWDFEINGSKRLSKIGSAGHMNEFVFQFLNLVEKGNWTEKILILNEQYDIGLDINSRPIPSKVHRIRKNVISAYFNFCLKRIPYIWRVNLSEKIKKILISY
jgi:hypothetical protein